MADTEIEWMNLKAPELRRLAAADAIVIVPVASVEQHGQHLPVQVDTLLAGEVAKNAARRIAPHHPVVVAPTVWSGLAEHHMSYGGTITLDLATFTALLRCVCQSILRHGFRRILLLNGHGGNIAALTAIVGDLSTTLGTPLATATYWQVAAKAFGEILEKQDTVRHADEAETAMMMALRPDLVDTAAIAAPGTPEEALRPEGAVYRFRLFTDWTQSGAIGVPAAATAEKGRRLLDAAGEALADALLGPVWADLDPHTHA